MHDAEVVGAGERGAHLLEDVDAPGDGQRPARQLAGERRADEVLHHEVELALLGLADVVDVDDVGVIDAVGGARLAQHPGAEVRLAAQVGPDQLEGDHPIDEDVPGAVHDAHPALAEPRLEAIPAGDDLSDQRVRRPSGCPIERFPLRCSMFVVVSSVPRASPQSSADEIVRSAH